MAFATCQACLKSKKQRDRGLLKNIKFGIKPKDLPIDFGQRHFLLIWFQRSVLYNVSIIIRGCLKKIKTNTRPQPPANIFRRAQRLQGNDDTSRLFFEYFIDSQLFVSSKRPTVKSKSTALYVINFISFTGPVSFQCDIDAIFPLRSLNLYLYCFRRRSCTR